MTNQVTDLSNKLTKNYDPELFLGRLCWYSIPDSVVISRDDFIDKLNARGITFGANIPEIRPVDVFKRGCTASERNKYCPTDIERGFLGIGVDCHINYLFRNSGQDKNKVWRSLVREIVDSTGHTIDYTEIASLTYDRASKTIDKTFKVSYWLDFERGIVNDVLSYFNEEADRITPYAIREFVRKGLEWNIHAIKVRPSGGIYFTQEQFSNTVSNLETVINEVGGSFHTLPLLDDSKQREMLKKAFEEESLGDINEMMAEISDILINKKNISADRYLDFKTRYDKLIKKVLEYSDVLDEAMELTSGYLEVAEKQIILLLDNVKVVESL